MSRQGSVAAAERAMLHIRHKMKHLLPSLILPSPGEYPKNVFEGIDNGRSGRTFRRSLSAGAKSIMYQP